MSRTLGVAAVQMDVSVGDTNFSRMCDKIEEISKYFPWVELIIFSEQCIHGPGMDFAQPIPGEISNQLCEVAREYGKWIIPGSMSEKTKEGIYNTAFVINSQGEIVTKYRKMFPWRPIEKCLSGSEFCVFDIPGCARIGLTICYDQWFPEVCRQLVWMGAEIICNPILTATSDRTPEIIISQANAIVNQVYFVSVNGLNDGGSGHSLIIDPNGRILQEAGEIEQIMPEIIDLDLVTRVREHGTLGMSQVLKSFKHEDHKFPVYTEGIDKGDGFKKLGSLEYKKEIIEGI